MKPVLEQLIATYPLAKRWGEPILYAEEARIGDVPIRMCGLVVHDRDGQRATGSAASRTELPLTRAFFELIERTSVLEAMERSTFEVTDEFGRIVARAGQLDVFPRTNDETRQRYARSNGVAAGPTWAAARDAARLELIERDRVLAAWYGEFEPQPVSFEPPPSLASLDEVYDLRAYAFDLADEEAPEVSPRVRGVFAFPRSLKNPLSFGFGAGFTAADALASGVRECVQRLAFLWGEQIPIEEPRFAPTPEFHQEFFLRPCMHSVLREWLDGEHARQPVTLLRPAIPRGHRFVDLTPRELSTRIAVVRALPVSELPLVFGRGHPALAGEIIPRLAVHPIA